jgi:hypothetical protein
MGYAVNILQPVEGDEFCGLFDVMVLSGNEGVPGNSLHIRSTWWMVSLVASRGAAGLVKSGKTNKREHSTVRARGLRAARLTLSCWPRGVQA